MTHKLGDVVEIDDGRIGVIVEVADSEAERYIMLIGSDKYEVERFHEDGPLKVSLLEKWSRSGLLKRINKEGDREMASTAEKVLGMAKATNKFFSSVPGYLKPLIRSSSSKDEI